MEGAERTRGEVCNFKQPNWRPLERVAEEIAGAFMWMFEVDMENGDRVHAYKHIDTRCYLHLGVSGTAYAYVDEDDYRVVDLGTLLSEALMDWGAFGATPADLEACERIIARADAGN